MGGVYSVAAKGRCTTSVEEEGRKNGGERDATGKEEIRRHHPPLSGATQPPFCSGLALLASNQDEVLIERKGHVSTIRHRIGCRISQVSNIRGSFSQGIEKSSKYNIGKEKPATCLLPIMDDGDFCPTCLDEYTEENPKIVTKCKHHFHLSCILEWKERSNKCPICGQIMAFNEA